MYSAKPPAYNYFVGGELQGRSMECPRCHHDNRLAARFCEACGTAFTPAFDADGLLDTFDGERRRATVLFADLSGYTAMGEHLDPEELDDFVARIKTRAAQIVEHYGGSVNQFRGDEIFALFGVPAAHDDDPVRAVRAARALHTMARTISPEIEERIGLPLRFHSSVSSGLVVASGRDARDGAVGVTGDAVNMGARLAMLARPDEILLNADARAQVEDFFETTALDPVILKGKAEPVIPFRVERETPTQTRFEAAERRGLTRFAGRRAELSVLHTCLDKAMSGHGQLVTVTGDPGVGKSRLVFEFRHGLDRNAVTVLQGRCQSFGMATPYLPFIDTLRRGLHLREGESSDDVHGKVVANILSIDPALKQYLPHYLHLLSIPSRAHRLAEDLQGVELRQALERALVSLIASNSRRKPIVWIVEDWHWTDDASTGALKNLVGIMGAFPLMVIVLYRPEYTGSWENTEHHTQIALGPLDVQDTGAIIKAVLNASSLPTGFAGLVHERTGGNPFFTEEISTALLEQGHVAVLNGRAEMSGPLETLDLPETVQATIRTRIDRLDRESREVLRVASVLGREFTGRLLQQVCRVGAKLAQVLDRLRAQDLVQTVRLAPEPQYMFKHVLTQVVVYETLLHQQRKALHAAAGNAIEALYGDRLEEHYEALAYHFSRSGNNAKAVCYLGLAGDKAAGVFSLPESRKHYRDAIALLDSQERSPDRMRERIDLTLKLAKASHYATSEELLRTLEVARDYAKNLGDKHRLARVAYWMGGVYRMLGNHPQVFAVLSECMKLAKALEDEELQAFSFHVMGRACYLTGDYAKGVQYMQEGIAISERLANIPEISYSCGFSADCFAWLGDFDRAFPLAERSLELAVASGDLSRQGGSFWYLAAVLCMHGDWEKALDAANRCVEFARRIGGAYLIGAGVSLQGWARFMLGDEKVGIALLKEGFQRIQDSGSMQGTGLYASMVADHLVLSRRGDEAIEYANRALDFYKAFGEGNGEAPAYRALGLAVALSPSPNWPDVDRHMNESVRAARQRGERPHLAITLLRHADLLWARNEPGPAQARLAEAERMFADMGMRWWLEESARVRESARKFQG
jgi:class 3 adenylate cyclase/tetratricopeptide (TPR) repeat protein